MSKSSLSCAVESLEETIDDINERLAAVEDVEDAQDIEERLEKKLERFEKRLLDVEYVTDNLKSNIGEIATRKAKPVTDVTPSGSNRIAADTLPTDSNGLILVKEGQQFVTEDGQIYRLCPRADNSKLDFAFCGLLKKKKAA